MNKTKIEWCDYTINPIHGLCPVSCTYCYSHRMYKRYKWDETIRFEVPNWHKDIHKIAINEKPTKYFIGSMIDLFHKDIPQDWVKRIINDIAIYKKHTFIFLTKCPENLPKEFPENCWVGVSTTGNDCRSGLEDIFGNIQAKIKFVSIEPLLDYTPMDFRWVDWAIIGQQTPKSIKTQPQIRWLMNIVESADKEQKPVFLKNNLEPLIPHMTPIEYNKLCFSAKLRQEFPAIK